MIIENGNHVLVSNRRLFESDEARYFVGRVMACEGPLVKAEGYSFVRDLGSGEIVKKQEKRIRVFSLSCAGHMVYELPNDINVEAVDMQNGNGNAILLDGRRQLMNLSERTHCGHF